MTVRQDPALALARRRANGQLVEIQQQDLAFSSDECLEFLQQRLILQGQQEDSISPEQALALTQATEGWITGIQLSAMSAIPTISAVKFNSDDKNLNRDMADYLFEEVFSQQPKPLQDFLLFTACVEKFCPALTNNLCNIEHSYHVIKELEAANLFIIALDNHQSWYRYHDLFRQFLLLHFQTLGQEQQQILHLTAANWFEEGGYHELALQHTEMLKNRGKCSTLFEDTAAEKTTSTSKEIEGLIEPLTKRETQVMALVHQGLSNKEIAEQLFISLNTLKVHIRNLYGKMGVENRTQALLLMKG